MAEEMSHMLLFEDGWLKLLLAEDQYLPGYSILYAPGDVFDLHVLPDDLQARFLTAMATVGAIVLAQTGARRMNYLIQGNVDPYLHVHIVPRFEWEELPWREGPAALYPEVERVAMRTAHSAPDLPDRLRQPWRASERGRLLVLNSRLKHRVVCFCLTICRSEVSERQALPTF